MTRKITRFLVWLGLLAWSGPGLADLVGRAEQALMDFSTLQADFVQISSDGTAISGKLYLRRPNRMRIDYEESVQLSLVATPLWLHVDDKQARQVASYPVRQTPLAPLLQKQISLRGDDFETRIAEADGIAQITLSRQTGEAAGELLLEFELPKFRLRRWIVTDAVGVKTMVTLQNVRLNLPMKIDNFIAPQYEEDED